MKAFDDLIEKNRERYLDELFCLLRQKSISATGEGMAETVELLRGYMEQAGIRTRLLLGEGLPAIYGEVGCRKGAGGPTVLIYGHYDVQPAFKEDGWEKDPFHPYVKDGRIICRGASDDKGQLFTHIKAAEAFRQVFGDLPVNLKFLFEGEEEIGSPTLEKLVADHRDLLACDLVVVSDSHIHESGRPVIILGLKGMLYVQLSLQGARGDLHSKFAAALDSPVWRMVALLSTLRDRRGNVLIDGFYDDILPPTETERRLLSEIPYDREEILKNLGASRLRRSDAFGDHYFWNMMFTPTCNIDGVLAGYTGKGAKTVLPSKAAVKLDFRLVPGQTSGKVLSLLESHLAKSGFDDVIMEVEGRMEPCRADGDGPFVRCIEDALWEAWGEKPLLYPSIGGSGPNSIFFKHLGVDCITVPYAGADQNNHGVQENMLLKGFFHGIRTNGRMYRNLAERGKL